MPAGYGVGRISVDMADQGFDPFGINAVYDSRLAFIVFFYLLHS
jgi:hypothetical protein